MTGALSDRMRTRDPERRVAAPLLAVCALCGGSGASTLAYLIAAWTAGISEEPVLVCDAGEPTAGLSAYAGVESVRSVDEIATDLAAGVPVSGGLFASPRPGLRLIAAAPRAGMEMDPEAAAQLIRDAREEHTLTIVDCGRLATETGRLALEQATHVAWILPATVSGVIRARRVLAIFEPESGRREIVVARADPGGRQAPMAELTALADGRHGPVVLMPHVPDLGEHSCDDGLAAAQITLEALASVLRR
jgi:MinD-like ATPase involved in chromosome partitioning or flagellar assembly